MSILIRFFENRNTKYSIFKNIRTHLINTVLHCEYDFFIREINIEK